MNCIAVDSPPMGHGGISQDNFHVVIQFIARNFQGTKNFMNEFPRENSFVDFILEAEDPLPHSTSYRISFFVEKKFMIWKELAKTTKIKLLEN